MVSRRTKVEACAHNEKTKKQKQREKSATVFVLSPLWHAEKINIPGKRADEKTQRHKRTATAQARPALPHQLGRTFGAAIACDSSSYWGRVGACGNLCRTRAAVRLVARSCEKQTYREQTSDGRESQTNRRVRPRIVPLENAARAPVNLSWPTRRRYIWRRWYVSCLISCILSWDEPGRRTDRKKNKQTQRWDS